MAGRDRRELPVGETIARSKFPAAAGGGGNTVVRLSTIFGVICGAAAWVMSCEAAEIQLKNGMRLQGKVVRLTSLGSGKGAADDENIQAYPIVMVENDWQRYYVSQRQVESFDKQFLPAVEERFRIDQKRTSQHGSVGSVAGLSQLEPFNEFGQRSIKFPGNGRATVVIQGITEISPSHVTISSLTHNWVYGVATSTLPAQEIETILRQRLKPGDVEERLALARFFAQAEMYDQAFSEFEAIGREFPELAGRVGEARELLLQSFGRNVLGELNRRHAAGQHELAESKARALERQPLGGEVRAEVQEFLGRYAILHNSLEKAELLLGDLHSRIDEPELMDRLQGMRSVVNEELSLETLSRLDPFLRAEKDPQLTPREKLALGYSGWVVGPSNAVTDLNQAVRLWDARHLVLEYLRSVHPHDHEHLLGEIRKLEGIGTASIQQLIALLPPWLEAPPADEMGQSLVELSPAGDKDRGIRYRVLLPPEYSRDHRYPLLVVLRPEGRTLAQTLQWWGGSPGSQGPAQRRGFIVIAPDYLGEERTSYDYDIPAQRVVLESLRDARRRFSVDPDRVFLTGHGMGGDAAFDLGFAHPDEFAGVIPICGYCGEYATYLRENGQYTGWYVVAGELDRSTHSKNSAVLSRCFLHGTLFDMVYVQFIGRGLELFADELPRIFDWMESRRRGPQPKKFTISSLRRTDNEYFNFRAEALAKNVILPLPAGVRFPGVMTLEVNITPGNTIHVKSPSKWNTVWLNESLIDLDKPVTVTEANPARRGLLAPDLAVLLEDLRIRSDRSRLYSIRIDF